MEQLIVFLALSCYTSGLSAQKYFLVFFTVTLLCKAIANWRMGSLPSNTCLFSRSEQPLSCRFIPVKESINIWEREYTSRRITKEGNYFSHLLYYYSRPTILIIKRQQNSYRLRNIYNWQKIWDLKKRLYEYSVNYVSHYTS